MASKIKSQRLGLFSEGEIQFLYNKNQKRYYSDEAIRKNYERIVKKAKKSFQDLDIAIIHLPEKHRQKIDFTIGLRGIQKQLNRHAKPEESPHLVLENTRDNLDDCLKIIRKGSSRKIEEIAEKDFEKVKAWLDAFQRYPKPQGAQI